MPPPFDTMCRYYEGEYRKSVGPKEDKIIFIDLAVPMSREACVDDVSS